MDKIKRIMIVLLGMLYTLNMPTEVMGALTFEHISNKEGFNQNTINCIAEDKNGYFWFGTPNGLIQFDGYDFTDFTHNHINENGISNNFITSLYTDNNGVLWIGSNGGLDVYLPSLEKFIKVPLASDIAVNHIAADPSGRIWISNSNSLIPCELTNAKKQVTFQIGQNVLKDSFQLDNLVEFYFPNQNVCMLILQKGLCSLTLDDTSSPHPTATNLKHFKSFETYQITDIEKINDIYWIGTNAGLFQAIHNGKEMQILQHIDFKNKNYPKLHITTLYKDDSDNVWVGTKQNGVYIYHIGNGNIDHYGHDPKNPNGISSPYIKCFLKDKFNVLWIGTAQGGINKLNINQKQFINYSNNPYDPHTISGNLITTILEDRSGKLWVADYNELLCRSTNSVNTTNIAQLSFESLKSTINQSINSQIILSMFEDTRGYIWFGTINSVFIYNPVSKTFNPVVFYDKEKKIEITNCLLISQADENTILLGGNSLLLVKNPWGKIENTTHATISLSAFEDQSMSYINTFEKGKNDHFWFGSTKGLFLCKMNKDTFYIQQTFTSSTPNQLNLKHNNVFSLLEDKQDHLWIGTFGGGLHKMQLNEDGEPLKIEYFGKNNLLPNDAIYGILQESDKYIWLSTDMGLCRLNIQSNQVDLFDVRDGLPNNNFRKSAYLKSKSGYFFFGGLNGLTAFKPELIKMNQVLPKPTITGLSINNSMVHVGQEVYGDTVLRKSIFETNHVRINHNTRTLSLQVAVQHSAIPSKNQFAYMLDGFNNDWILSKEGKSTINYTNLPAGDYIFKMKAANNDGIWNEESRDLHIKILPPWHNTWWSYTLFSILTILIIFITIRIYVSIQTLKHELRYEQIDKKRVVEVNQSKFRFFTNISHEFRTPLTLIAGPLESAIENNTTPVNTKYLNTIKENTKRLLNLVDQLTTFRKMEQGHLNLKYSRIELGRFVYPTTESFEEYALKKSINFFYKINSPNEEIVIDVEKTERIIFNFLSNAFRHTPANGDISINADILEVDNKKMVKFDVIDTGKGIPSEKQEKVFERFYQIEDRDENTGGTGIGLAYCKSLIDMMGGSISVESIPNKRTCFSVLIPSENSEEIASTNLSDNPSSFIKDWIPTDTSSIATPSENHHPKQNTPTLLIVDDEDGVREFLTNELHQQYNIICAENGLEALEKLNHVKPDAIISDVMMPKMDGFELCEKIKSDSSTCHIPVILLTALGDNDSKFKGLEFGADDYISKPFSPRHIKIRVEKLIENRQKLNEYFSKNTSIPDNSFGISKRDKKFLEDLNQAIDKNISDSNFGVEELASEIGISTSHFYRKLKQLTGQVPNAYLRNYRLERAAELMRSNQGYNGLEVMYQIGIESNSYFSTAFKKLYGVRPSVYIKNHSATAE